MPKLTTFHLLVEPGPVRMSSATMHYYLNVSGPQSLPWKSLCMSSPRLHSRPLFITRCKQLQHLVIDSHGTSNTWCFGDILPALLECPQLESLALTVNEPTVEAPYECANAIHQLTRGCPLIESFSLKNSSHRAFWPSRCTDMLSAWKLSFCAIQVGNRYFQVDMQEFQSSTHMLCS